MTTPTPSKFDVVVGAGLPGISASLELAKHGRNVLLLDSAPVIGGLLRSYESDGFLFDYGTHFANLTGLPQLDELLFGDFERDWTEFPYLRAGNFWNGVLNEDIDNPDLNTLGRATHDRCLAEVVAAKGWSCDRTPGNARDYFLEEYGPSLVEVFFDPVFKKFVGRETSELHHDAWKLFNFKRFVVLDSLASNYLKRLERFDARLSFHRHQDSPSHRLCLYPKKGGIGTWIDQLELKLAAENVRVKCGVQIDRILVESDRVTGVMVGGNLYEVDHLVWTVAPVFFSRLAGLVSNSVPPVTRMTVLVGLIFDAPPLTECHYLTVFDTALKSFRVTLYSNFRAVEDKRYPITLEFLCDSADVSRFNWVEIALKEIQEMGVVRDPSRLIATHVCVVHPGFPVQTNEVVAGLSRQVQAIAPFKNVSLGGRASGEGWFLNDLIKGGYYTALKIVNEK